MTIRIISLLLITIIVALASLASANTQVVSKASSLLHKGEFTAAVEFVEQAIEQDSNDAAIHNIAGNVFGTKAQNSSVFSAPGYAKKSLKAFKEAVRLEPSNPEYRMGLMAYYLMAPGIVGGDTDLGKAQALKIAELDPAKGFLASAMVYQYDEQKDKLRAHYDSAAKAFALNAEILFNSGVYYQGIEEFELANKAFSKIAALEKNSENELFLHQAYYQLGLNSFLSNTNTDEGIAYLNQFLNEASDDYRLPPKPWAKFRLAQLHLKKNDSKTAKTLMSEARAESDHKELNKQIKKAMKKLK